MANIMISTEKEIDQDEKMSTTFYQITTTTGTTTN